MGKPNQHRHASLSSRPLDLGLRSTPAPLSWRLAVHGAGVEIECGVPSLTSAVERCVGYFSEAALPAGFTPATGTIDRYDAAEVVRHLPVDAKRLQRRGNETVEYFERDERFWVVDERWGMSEMNLLRGTWRSWVLPQPTLDAVRTAEAAVLAPMAQVLRSRGVHLLPAVSVARDGWAALLVCPYGLGPELQVLLKSGYHVIGQRWTALREEDGRVLMLHVPGFVERPLAGPKRRLTLGRLDPWVDLRSGQHRNAFRHHAFADAVLLVAPGRRPRAGLRLVEDAEDAARLLRGAWPVPALHPHRRLGALPAKLAADCACADVQLSRDPRDLLALLRSLRDSDAAAQRFKLELTLTPWARLTGRGAKSGAGTDAPRQLLAA